MMMAEAVGNALSTGEHLAVQAGTGTGKSLAYLVPSLRHAVETGGTVVVSTATIALQNQLVDRDLPRLSAALRPALGVTPSHAILKGRGNYLCLHRVSSGPVDEADPDEIDIKGGGEHTAATGVAVADEHVLVNGDTEDGSAVTSLEADSGNAAWTIDRTTDLRTEAGAAIDVEFSRFGDPDVVETKDGAKLVIPAVKTAATSPCIVFSM